MELQPALHSAAARVQRLDDGLVPALNAALHHVDADREPPGPRGRLRCGPVLLAVLRWVQRVKHLLFYPRRHRRAARACRAPWLRRQWDCQGRELLGLRRGDPPQHPLVPPGACARWRRRQHQAGSAWPKGDFADADVRAHELRATAQGRGLQAARGPEPWGRPCGPARGRADAPGCRRPGCCGLGTQGRVHSLCSLEAACRGQGGNPSFDALELHLHAGGVRALPAGEQELGLCEGQPQGGLQVRHL
mmetsp:Transcript_96708/g.273503  ORF Transcript_96708/g.273503 Transcript_96708/m.273503 type:complete len:248 (+) Transcript_96708:561-1304(+)